MHIVLSDENNTIETQDNNLIIHSSDAGFREEDNNLIMSAEYTDQKMFDAQKFGEINLFSTDILGG